MAVAVFTSFDQVCDSNGVPVSGALIYVYDANSTTPKSLFTDTALSVSTANPIECGSDGRHTVGMVYFATGTYKVVVKTAAGATIFTRDNIDPGTPIGSGALAIANGGTGSTTAATARIALGVPSQTSFDSLSTDVSNLSNSVAALVSHPQGYLTLTSATPIITGDVSAASTVYYTPFIGNVVPIYSGTAFVSTTFSELSLALVANHLASTIYDCFVISDSGTVRLVTGPAWNSSTAGSCSRGTGASTTELTRLNGILVNANAMTGRYGATTVSVAVNCGTYVGSLFIDGSAGQVTCHRAYGQSRKWGVWNAYNRMPLYLKAGDSTASWVYTTATLRPANNSTANSLTVFCGLAEEVIHTSYNNVSAVSTSSQVAIGWNSTTAASGLTEGTGITGSQMLKAQFIQVPSLGVNVVTALEAGSGGGNAFSGTQSSMVLSADWRG